MLNIRVDIRPYAGHLRGVANTLPGTSGQEHSAIANEVEPRGIVDQKPTELIEGQKPATLTARPVIGLRIVHTFAGKTQVDIERPVRTFVVLLGVTGEKRIKRDLN